MTAYFGDRARPRALPRPEGGARRPRARAEVLSGCFWAYSALRRKASRMPASVRPSFMLRFQAARPPGSGARSRMRSYACAMIGLKSGIGLVRERLHSQSYAGTRGCQAERELHHVCESVSERAAFALNPRLWILSAVWMENRPDGPFPAKPFA